LGVIRGIEDKQGEKEKAQISEREKSAHAAAVTTRRPSTPRDREKECRTAERAPPKGRATRESGQILTCRIERVVEKCLGQRSGKEPDSSRTPRNDDWRDRKSEGHAERGEKKFNKGGGFETIKVKSRIVTTGCSTSPSYAAENLIEKLRKNQGPTKGGRGETTLVQSRIR